MPYLHLVRNGKSPKIFPLHRRVTSIGTGDGCDIQLSDPLVRELHAVVSCDGRRFSIAAWDSRQPLRINGKARKRRRLVHRDVIELGASQLVFILTDERSLRAGAASKSVVEAYRCLAEFSADLLCAESPSVAFARLVDAVLELTGADKGFLILCDDDDVRRVAAARTARGQDLCNAEWLLSDAVLERALRLQRPVVVADTLRDSEWNAQPSVLRFYLTSILCVPILGEERPLGALYVGKTSIVEVFSEEGLELLTVLASQAALLLQNFSLQEKLRQERQLLVDQCEWFGLGALLGASETMFEVFHALRALAPTELTVLIQGGTGTGKTLVAKELHRLSPRQHGPFVTYRCDSAPEQLAAQLFGGALDSVGEQPSKFREARGGTLLLEEIAELPWELQYRLLQTLQQRSQPLDCRLLFSTCRDLKALVATKRFREDLYWQIQMPTLELPPLRLRGRDNLLLARRFLAIFAERHGSPVRDFSPAAIAAIRRYSWPGNVSELEGRVLKASIVARQPCIEPEDLGLEPESLPPVVPLGEATKCFAERYVRSALTQVQGDPHRAARLLDVDVRTVQRHLGV